MTLRFPRTPVRVSRFSFCDVLSFWAVTKPVICLQVGFVGIVHRFLDIGAFLVGLVEFEMIVFFLRPPYPHRTEG